MTTDRKIMEVYESLPTQHKRVVSKLIRALSQGEIPVKQVTAITRKINKHASDEKKKRPSGYILFYQEQYPQVKADSPSLSLGDIATEVGARWEGLGTSGRSTWNSKASAS